MCCDLESECYVVGLGKCFFFFNAEQRVVNSFIKYTGIQIIIVLEYFFVTALD